MCAALSLIYSKAKVAIQNKNSCCESEKAFYFLAFYANTLPVTSVSKFSAQLCQNVLNCSKCLEFLPSRKKIFTPSKDFIKLANFFSIEWSIQILERRFKQNRLGDWSYKSCFNHFSIDIRFLVSDLHYQQRNTGGKSKQTDWNELIHVQKWGHCKKKAPFSIITLSLVTVKTAEFAIWNHR